MANLEKEELIVRLDESNKKNEFLAIFIDFNNSLRRVSQVPIKSTEA